MLTAKSSAGVALDDFQETYNTYMLMPSLPTLALKPTGDTTKDPKQGSI